MFQTVSSAKVATMFLVIDSTSNGICCNVQKNQYLLQLATCNLLSLDKKFEGNEITLP
jgi:hypothetical protein